MAEKKKRQTLPARGVPAAKPAAPAAVPDRRPVIEKEDFGENTFAGALEAVRGVLEQASTPETAKLKPRKKG